MVFFGQETTTWRPERLSRAGLARTFQVPQIFPEMSALENVLMGAWLRREPHPPSPRPIRKPTIVFPWWGCWISGTFRPGICPCRSNAWWNWPGPWPPGRGCSYWTRLPRASARARCNVWTAGLLKLRDQGLTLLLTDHLFSLLEAVADRVLALDRGEIIAQGPPATLIHHPEVVSAYLGTRCGSDAAGDA